MKALFTYNYGDEKLEKLKKLGLDIIVKSEKDLYYTDELKDVEILACYNPFKTLDIERMKNLKLILLTSTGIDQVPLDIVKENNITLCNNKYGYNVPIGEWIVLKILEMLKESKMIYSNQEKNKWKINMDILELTDKNVTFIGTGNIATEAAKRLEAFECNICGINTTGHSADYFKQCFSMKESHKILSKSDIVVVTIPYTKDTYKLVNKDMIDNMKDGVYFINISRGDIVDEKELIKALKNKKIKMAALDVFEEEPLSDDNEMWKLENVLISSHNSWVSEMRNVRRFSNIYQNISNYISGEEVITKVDLNKGY